MTANSSALVTVQAEHKSRVWIVALGKKPRPRNRSHRELTNTTLLRSFVDARRADRLRFDGERQRRHLDYGAGRGRSETVDEQRRRQSFPSVSPDGRYIVFTSTRAAGNTNICGWTLTAATLKTDRRTDRHFPGVVARRAVVVYMSNVAASGRCGRYRSRGATPCNDRQFPRGRSFRPTGI